jgi:hypothetical protein
MLADADGNTAIESWADDDLDVESVREYPVIA